MKEGQPHPEEPHAHHRSLAQQPGHLPRLPQEVRVREPPQAAPGRSHPAHRSEEHTSELQSLMRNSYAVFCLKKKKTKHQINIRTRNSKQDPTQPHKIIISY